MSPVRPGISRDLYWRQVAALQKESKPRLTILQNNLENSEVIHHAEVTSLAFGGEGIIRHQGMVVFVPFTAPGDIITCRITQQKKSFAFAEVIEIHKKSLLRTIPKCPYYERCGGCQLQHLIYSAQTDSKHQGVVDALQRIGKLNVEVQPTIPADQQWEYRRHVTLHVRENAEGFSLGYVSVDNSSLIQVEQCPIYIQTSEPIIHQVQLFFDRLKRIPEIFHNEDRIALFKAGVGKYVLHFMLSHFPKEESLFKEALKEFPEWIGILITTPEKAASYGVTELSCTVEGMNFKYSPQAFIQNHPEQSQKIYRLICELANRSSHQCILDLYCGIGISSLLLAKQGAKVVGVEGNKAAIQLAKDNAAANSMTSVSFLQSDVKRGLTELLKKHHPDLIVVNPPRTGLDPEVIDQILRNPPKEIIYISCMPTTLTRDLKVFCKERYKVQSCQPFDMFPQTAHVETVVHLT